MLRNNGCGVCMIPAFEAINSVALCLMVCVFELANIFLLPQQDARFSCQIMEDGVSAESVT